ncbi:MAG TPA: hypothetical protein VJN48_17550 [Terriglobales bacterium]|nr:hypothetical protein [Terriglobales bacterium]
MAIRTVFLMKEECALGARQGWHEFVRDYAPLARTLLQQYFPTLAPEMDMHVNALFERARANQNEWFRNISFSNEREFLMAFRQLVFAYGREAERVPVPQLSLEQVRQIMKDLPVTEREMLWLFIKGYSAPQIARMMNDAENTAEKVKSIADERLKQLLPATTPDAFSISARVLMEEAEKTRSEQCVALRTFNNIVNGQITWRERELAEEHVRDCFNCLDRFTAFQEMIRLRKDARPLQEGEVEPILVELHLPPAKSRGVLARLFAR